MSTMVKQRKREDGQGKTVGIVPEAKREGNAEDRRELIHRISALTDRTKLKKFNRYLDLLINRDKQLPIE